MKSDQTIITSKKPKRPKLTMRTAITVCAVAVILLVIAAVISRDLDLSQEHAYAEMSYIDSYDSTARSHHFDDVLEAYDATLMSWLSDELAQALNAMHKRTMGEIVSQARYLDEFQPFNEGGLYHAEPDRYERYPHTTYFQRLAEWSDSYGYQTDAEQRKVRNLIQVWQSADQKASDLNLITLRWGSSSRDDGSYRSEKRDTTYYPMPDREDIVYSLIDHYSELLDSLNMVEPVFIDFAGDSEMDGFTYSNRTIRGVIPDSIRSARTNERVIQLADHGDLSSQILRVLRECRFTVGSPDSVAVVPETCGCLSNDRSDLYLLSESTVCVIWMEANNIMDRDAFRQGVFTIDPAQGRIIAGLSEELQAAGR